MRIIALAFLLCVASVSEAAQLPLSVLPGGVGGVQARIQSIRERKFADLVQQKTDFSVHGAAALATVLRQAYWLDVNEEQVIEGMLAKLRSGSCPRPGLLHARHEALRGKHRHAGPWLSG